MTRHSRLVAGALVALAAAGFALTAGAQPAPRDRRAPHAHTMQAPMAQAAPVQAKPVAAAAMDVSVDISNFAFSPATITVAPGATVTWTNKDDEPHTVTATDKAYRSSPLDTNERYGHVYQTPGEYHYFCSLHPHMTGVVIVRTAAPPTPTQKAK